MPPLIIGGVMVEPGQRRRVDLPVARLPTGAWTSIPLEVIRGTNAGPTCWLSGAIHGDEIDGVEIIRQVSRALDPIKVRGTVIAVPIVNGFGFISESRYLPDRRDLNRAFPGSERGSLAGRLAALFMREVVDHCDYGLDFHCGSDDRTNLPQVRADLTDEETLKLAKAFGAPVMMNSKPPKGSLRAAAVRRKKKVLLYEGGEARRFTPEAVEAGVRGSLRVLAALDIADLAKPAPDGESVLCKTTWVRAPRSGICRLDAALGDEVEKGQSLGVIGDAFGDSRVRLKARTKGIVLGRRLNPLVTQGDAVVHIGAPEG